MLADLKVLEDNLYTLQALETFSKKYTVHEVIKQLNKFSKKENKERVKYYFSKLSASPFYKNFLAACLDEEKEKREEFVKYVSSENSEQFFTLLQNHKEDVLHIIENQQKVVFVLIKLISYEFGIKLIKLFKDLYDQGWEKYECLYQEDIRKGLAEGLGLFEGETQLVQGVDTVAQVRYFQVAVNIGLLGGRCFKFVSDLLDRAINLYKTEDILLKLALVQIIALLGESVETAELLRAHKVWKEIEKDATDPDQQFYVRKYLLILLIDMANQGKYNLNPRLVKDLIEFIRVNISANGEYLQCAIDTISHLFHSFDGSRIVVQNSQVFGKYLGLSRSTLDSLKGPFYDSLVSLVSTNHESNKQAKESPKYKLVINILNCIGNPSLATSLTHNLHANNYMIEGLESFAKWFSGLLLLPFQDNEIKLLDVFASLLNYYQVVEALFQNQETTRYLLKKPVVSENNKVLREKKSQLIQNIIRRGREEWKGLQLEQFTRELQKLLSLSTEEAIYALDVQ